MDFEQLSAAEDGGLTLTSYFVRQRTSYFVPTRFAGTRRASCVGCSASADGGAAVVELEVRLRLQRDEKVEGEVAVGRMREGEDGSPVVQITLQRDGVHGELALLKVVARVPRRR